MNSKATWWAVTALPRGTETKVHTAKKCIALGWNISCVSEKLSPGTQPPRSIAAPLHSLAVNLQEVATRHPSAGSVSYTCCTSGGIQVHIVPADPQLAGRVRAPGDGAEARACLNEHTQSHAVQNSFYQFWLYRYIVWGSLKNIVSLSFCPCNNYALEVRKKSNEKRKKQILQSLQLSQKEHNWELFFGERSVGTKHICELLFLPGFTLRIFSQQTLSAPDRTREPSATDGSS